MHPAAKKFDWEMQYLCIQYLHMLIFYSLLSTLYYIKSHRRSFIKNNSGFTASLRNVMYELTLIKDPLGLL